MRDIELLPVGDDAYALPSPAGLPADTTLVDPSFTDTKAYAKPSLGGEFGPGAVPVLSGPADGGAALLAPEVLDAEADAEDEPEAETEAEDEDEAAPKVKSAKKAKRHRLSK